MEFNIPLE